MDGGGGTSTGGVYSVSGMVGQPEAGHMSGGNFSLVGGFWSVIAIAQTPTTYLSARHANTAVVLWWPKADPEWKLEFTTSLDAGGTHAWTLIPPPYATNDTDCVVTEPVSVGSKFYRLRKP